MMIESFKILSPYSAALLMRNYVHFSRSLILTRPDIQEDAAAGGGGREEKKKPIKKGRKLYAAYRLRGG
jgi:hypothetical protein